MASIGAIIVCDDIRKEINGKDILIGVYGGDILVSGTPFVLVLGIWFEYFSSKPGKQSIIATASFSGRTISKVKAEIDTSGEPATGIGMPGLLINGEDEGDLVVEIVANDDAQTFSKTKRIRLAQSSTTDSSGVLPPS
jgi:hypothetical protein